MTIVDYRTEYFEIQRLRYAYKRICKLHTIKADKQIPVLLVQK